MDEWTILLIALTVLVVITLSCIVNDPPELEVKLQECLDGCVDEYDVETEGHRLCTEGCTTAYEEAMTDGD